MAAREDAVGPVITSPGILAVISGCSALMYEILWFRLFANLWGTTMIAASVVASLFLGGVAAGSLTLGRRIESASNPERWLAALEGGIGLCGVLMPVCLHGLIASIGNGALSGSAGMFLSAVAMLVPTFLMGGTLPALCCMQRKKSAVSPLPWVYALNTLGAASGVMIAGFILLPLAGDFAAIGVAVVGNGIVALIALAGGKFAGKAGEGGQLSTIQQAGDLRIYLLAAGGGAVALAAEMLWLRLFPLFVGNTTYAFSLVLSIYLVGIGAGSALYAVKRRMGIIGGEGSVFNLLSVMIAGLGISLVAFDQFGYLFYQGELTAGSHWWSLILMRMLISLPILLPLTLASGALFPALQHCSFSDNRFLPVSRLLAANIAGSIVGSIAVPMVLLPAFGLQGSFRVLVVILLLLIVVATPRGGWRSALRWGGLLVGIGLCLVSRPWDAHLLNSGIYIYAQDLKEEGGIDRDRVFRSLLHHDDGVEASVAIFQDTASGERSFTVNGKVDGGTGDMGTQVLLGQLPSLIHPAPESILVIGMGTGITASQVAGIEGSRVEVVEISPEVLGVLDYFEPEHHGVGRRSNVHIEEGDARRKLLHDQTRYQIIISEPSNPWQVGNNRLFTREFYQIARKRLLPGGVFCQWLPAYDLSPDQLRGAVATFIETFPGAHAFISQGSDIILVAGVDPAMPIDVAMVERKMESPKVRSAMAQAGVGSVRDLFREVYLGGPELLKHFAQGGSINTDGQNRLEYFRFASRQYLVENRDQMVAAARSVGGSRHQHLWFSGPSGEELRTELFSN